MRRRAYCKLLVTPLEKVKMGYCAAAAKGVRVPSLRVRKDCALARPRLSSEIKSDCMVRAARGCRAALRMEAFSLSKKPIPPMR